LAVANLSHVAHVAGTEGDGFEVSQVCVGAIFSARCQGLLGGCGAAARDHFCLTNCQSGGRRRAFDVLHVENRLRDYESGQHRQPDGRCQS